MHIKINNKGFTLRELLGVMVILATVVAIAIPTISTTLNKQKEKDIEHNKEQVVSKVELYYDKIKNDLKKYNKETSFSTGDCKVRIIWLKKNHYITEEQAKGLNDDDGVYRNKDNSYIFEYQEYDDSQLKENCDNESY